MYAQHPPAVFNAKLNSSFGLGRNNFVGREYAGIIASSQWRELREHHLEAIHQALQIPVVQSRGMQMNVEEFLKASVHRSISVEFPVCYKPNNTDSRSVFNMTWRVDGEFIGQTGVARSWIERYSPYLARSGASPMPLGEPLLAQRDLYPFVFSIVTLANNLNQLVDRFEKDINLEPNSWSPAQRSQFTAIVDKSSWSYLGL